MVDIIGFTNPRFYSLLTVVFLDMGLKRLNKPESVLFPDSDNVRDFTPAEHVENYWQDPDQWETDNQDYYQAEIFLDNRKVPKKITRQGKWHDP